MILVSACLAGINCKYNGKSNFVEYIYNMVKKGEALPVCPEQLGGLITPRYPSEIKCGTGYDVICRNADVIAQNGKNVTDEYINGANETLRICRMFCIEKAVLKSRSPSCGCGYIYDGSFSHKLIKGDGVTASLLKKNGIQVQSID